MIVKMLDLSTAHIREETAKWLSDIESHNKSPLIVYDKTVYGWWIVVPQEWDENTQLIPGDLLSILVYAKMADVAWVMFDRDSRIVPGLPVYEWESEDSF